MDFQIDDIPVTMTLAIGLVNAYWKAARCMSLECYFVQFFWMHLNEEVVTVKMQFHFFIWFPSNFDSITLLNAQRCFSTFDMVVADINIENSLNGSICLR